MISSFVVKGDEKETTILITVTKVVDCVISAGNGVFKRKSSLIETMI